ncbi:hypothetical protein K402DRAFT_390034 [Aulographum hederae CBS 113979]|uniref:Uncharacterized protein n=1 Tax=Aulographum hederae CBS 113979 TaxID=1176131 RepID=A0A6G1HB10_9PEZI|nr:hypothetical protein K402DRAFT_390034 [Aulographum hederae CBS 113979]
MRLTGGRLSQHRAKIWRRYDGESESEDEDSVRAGILPPLGTVDREGDKLPLAKGKDNFWDLRTLDIAGTFCLLHEQECNSDPVEPKQQKCLILPPRSWNWIKTYKPTNDECYSPFKHAMEDENLEKAVRRCVPCDLKFSAAYKPSDPPSAVVERLIIYCGLTAIQDNVERVHDGNVVFYMHGSNTIFSGNTRLQESEYLPAVKALLCKLGAIRSQAEYDGIKHVKHPFPTYANVPPTVLLLMLIDRLASESWADWTEDGIPWLPFVEAPNATYLETVAENFAAQVLSSVFARGDRGDGMLFPWNKHIPPDMEGEDADVDEPDEDSDEDSIA